jgi:hypothetical protein
MKSKKISKAEEKATLREKEFNKLAYKAWKDNGYVTNKEEAKDEIDSIFYLLISYAPNCLLKTIIDVDDLWYEFEKTYNGKEENFYQELDKYILKTWSKKAKEPLKDIEKTKSFIEVFHYLIYQNTLFGAIEKIIKLYKVLAEFNTSKEICDKDDD